MNIVIVLAQLAFLGAIGYGFINNIILLVTANSYGLFEVIRAIGVLAPPLGIVLGYVGG